MGTKTIGITEEVYERLRARKREDESFTDVVDRLLSETTADWREGFGALPEGDATDLERAVADSRERAGEGLSRRQADALSALSEGGDGDEAA